MRSVAVLAIAAFVLGCSEPSEVDGISDSDDGSGTSGAFGGQAVAPALAFRAYRVAPITGSVTAGFDLDGLVSSEVSDQACGQADATSPAGSLGIDNGVGLFWPDFYDVLGDSLESLFREGVSRGGEIPMLVLPAEATAAFAVARLQGAAVDFDGLLAGFQTFDLEARGQPFPVIQSPGRIIFGPAPAVVQVEVFAVAFSLPIDGLRGELTREEDGVWRGLVGGSFPLNIIPDPLAAIVSLAGGQPLAEALSGAADLADGSGRCDRISFGATVEAVDAFAVAPY